VCPYECKIRQCALKAISILETAQGVVACVEVTNVGEDEAGGKVRPFICVSTHFTNFQQRLHL
jgi:hypothetical protein